MRKTLLAPLILFVAMAGSTWPGRVHTEQRTGSVDVTRVPPAGASIQGRVVMAATGAPARRVVVTCRSDRDDTVDTVTGDDGRYRFAGLGPGRYHVTGARAGLVVSPLTSKAHWARPLVVEVSTGETVERQDLKLTHGATIGGRVTDEDGEPVIDITVQAARWSSMSGRLVLLTESIVRTDDRGVYRLYGLPPATYEVTAFADASQRTEESLRAALGGAESGQWGAVSNPRRASDRPVVERGDGVTVGAGQDLAGVDLVARRMRLPAVSVTVVDAAGEPAKAAEVLMLMVRGPDRWTIGRQVASVLSGGQAYVGGTARIVDLEPGEWSLAARVPGDAGPDLVGAAKIVIDGSPVSDVVLVAGQQIGTLSGRLVSDEPRATWPSDALNVTTVAVDGAEPPALQQLFHQRNLPVFLSGVGRALPMGLATRAAATRLRGAAPIGSPFATRTPPGSRFVVVEGLPAGWMVRSIRRGDEELSEVPVAVQPGAVLDGIEVQLTRRLTEVTGIVAGRGGVPVDDYLVVVYSVDSRLWPLAPRTVGIAFPDQRGVFSVRGLAPGDYLAVAIEADGEPPWLDPAFLERLRTEAARFRLDHGDPVRLSLPLLETEGR